jgi:GT2 family glycosyltransferase
MSTAIGVVIVTYNSANTVAACLDALGAQLAAGDQVWVVDNGSQDDTVAMVDGSLASLLRNPDNRGFAAAVNQGIEKLRQPLVLLLNPDVVLDDDALEIARDYMDGHPDVEILGARQQLPEGTADPAAHRSFKTPATYFYRALRLDKLFPTSPAFGRYYRSSMSMVEGPVDVDSVVGAFMVVRRSTLDRVGLLDERFFMYCEDEDLCWRVKCSGGRVVYHPGVVARHAKGSSARSRAWRTRYQWHRSLILFHRKNIAENYPAITNLAVYALIAASLAAETALVPVKRQLRPGGRFPRRRGTGVSATP